jgi:hypothetical protein
MLSASRFLNKGNKPSADRWATFFNNGTDGQTDWINIPVNVFDGLPAYTIETFIKITADHANGNAILGQACAGASTDQYWAVNTTGMFWRNGWMATPNTYGASCTIPLNTWHHVAAVFAGDGGYLEFFLDGVSIGKFNHGSMYWYYTGNNPLTIGKHYINSYGIWSSWHTGYLSNFRISSGVRYASSFTPPVSQVLTSDATTKLLTCNSSTLSDSGPGNIQLSASNTQIIKY